MVGGEKESLDVLLKDWRIRLYLAVLILFGILPLAIPMLLPGLQVGPVELKGLQFGMDFEGGSLISLELERAVDPTTMGTVTSILQERLNGFGLKDVSVKAVGDNYIQVGVSERDADRVNSLKEILSKQGKFEAIIDGEIALHSRDLVQIVTNPQEGFVYSSATSQWKVPFAISKEGSDEFARLAAGKCTTVDGVPECQRIYMFIDRPEDAVLLMPTELYEKESMMAIDPAKPGSYLINVSEFEHNALIDIIVADEVTQEVVDRIVAGNYSRVIIPEGVPYGLSGLQDVGYNTDIRCTANCIITREAGSTHWLWAATNLRSVLFLTAGVTTGDPIRNAVITGNADSTKEANEEMTEMAVLLKSGRLPVSLTIAATNTVSPTLGASFLSDSLMMGLLALIAVSLVVFARYRDLRITVPMMLANLSEVIIILGIAAIISWEIDIASVAGIVAALGTGIDQFIIITDEVKRGEEEGVVDSLVSKIKKAFKIIMASAATVTVAMLPLLVLGLGMLKGFAITTLIGLFVGVFIVRPAFGKTIEKIL